MVIAAGKFKAVCLQLMEQVQQSREEVIITKRGRPVAKLVPVDSAAPPLFGFMEGGVMIEDDIVQPTQEAWEADA